MLLTMLAALAGVPPQPPLTDVSILSEARSEQLCFPSGLSIMMTEDHRQPVVHVSSVYGVGVMDETPGMEGAAHLVEHLWFTSKRDGLTISQQIAKLGAHFQANTLLDLTAFYTTASSSQIEQLLDLEVQRLIDPLRGVTDAEVERELDIIAAEWSLRSGYTPMNLVRLFPPESLGLPVSNGTTGLGSAELRLADLGPVVAAYRPDNTSIHLRGDFDVQEMVELVHRVIPQHLLRGDKESCDPRVVGDRPAPPSGGIQLVTEADVEAPILVAAWPLPSGWGPRESRMLAAVAYIEKRMNNALWELGGIARDAKVDCNLVRGEAASVAVCSVEGTTGLAMAKVRDAMLSSSRRDALSTGRVHTRRVTDALAFKVAEDEPSPVFSEVARATVLTAHQTNTVAFGMQAVNALLDGNDREFVASAEDWMHDKQANVQLLLPDASKAEAVWRGDYEVSQQGSILGSNRSEVSHVEHLRLNDPPSTDSEPPRDAPSLTYTLDTGLRVRLVQHQERDLSSVAMQFDAPAGGEPGLPQAAANAIVFRFPDYLDYNFEDLLLMYGATAYLRRFGPAPRMHFIGTSERLDGQLWMLRVAAETATTMANTSLVPEKRREARERLETLDRRPHLAAELHRLHRLFPGDQVRGLSDTEQAAEIQGTNVAAMRKFNSGLWHPKHATLVVVSDRPLDEMKELVDTQFESWRGRGKPLDNAQYTDAGLPSISQTKSFSAPGDRSAMVVMECRIDDSAVTAQVADDLIFARLWDVTRQSGLGAYYHENYVWEQSGASVLRLAVRVPPNRADAAGRMLKELVGGLALLPEDSIAASAERAARKVPVRYLSAASWTEWGLSDLPPPSEQFAASRSVGRRELANWLSPCIGREAVTIVSPM